MLPVKVAKNYARVSQPEARALVDKSFCKKYSVFPLAIAGSSCVVVLGCSEPGVQKKRELEFAFGLPVEVQLESKDVIESAIDGSYHDGDSLLESLINFAAFNSASDIHIEPQKDSYEVNFRIEGDLVKGAFEDLGAVEGESLIRALMVKSGISVQQRVVFMDGSFQSEHAQIRCSFMKAYYGYTAVVRVLKSLEQDAFELDSDVGKILELSLSQPSGLVLVAGSTGSGKSTFLSRCLSELAQRGKKVISFEDPIERVVEGVSQVECSNSNLGELIISALRHDPDVISVGEVRTENTALAVLQACQTGHLVFSTIHAGSADEALGRAKLMKEQVSAVFRVCLVKLPCQFCSSHKQASRFQKETLGFQDEVLSSPGCRSCLGSGAQGRRLLVEAFQGGKLYSPLREQIKQLLVSSKISIEEALKALGIPKNW